MIICSCRRISTKDYDTPEDLFKRLSACDVQCGSCLRNFKLNQINTNLEDSDEKVHIITLDN